MKCRGFGLVCTGATLVLASGAYGGVASAQRGAVGSMARSDAIAAKVIPLKESATLKLTRNSVSIHEAEGQAQGTVQGPLSLRIDVETAERMSASFSGSSHSGAISGKGVAKYTVSGSILHFVGTISIVHGSGSYANASGTGRIEGTMNRLRKIITMTMSGSIST